VTTLSSRKFRQETGRAKKAAEQGPVFITERGQPTHVLLTIGEYRKISASGPTILDLLAMPGAGEVEFEPPRVNFNIFRRTR
jgi:prevent-host-death family protein